ncbi:efflux transporter outer membrane subunit [Pseudoduganella namucuonensis]|uniref:Efflux transporter, outer membrane factor (OMF) lipoprotein, NodT family n=1 Tax=Pseudoduganella namucuonensis TaxID=1035707 RepID=A0A1I7JME2_9BURK|nr:efflux transporter outer membrane subunit [Pseudoduganella namucuonensis]SFU86341.1 efflux transporter, outer membrane factor (OMF) lipoprotein, NodT family [Pseudoduganella namucuonensis]
MNQIPHRGSAAPFPSATAPASRSAATAPAPRPAPSIPARAGLLALAAALAGCAVGPKYELPATPHIAAFKEAEGWVPAAPADALERGPWWTLFGDPVLNELAASVEVSNQNIAAAAAAYAQARALVAEQRAQLFPSVDLGGSGTRGGGGGDTRTSSQYRVNIGGSWEPDIWGRLAAANTAAGASAQASAADLAAARLSAQGELAANYFSLRQQDAQKALLDATVAGYERVLRIAQNRFKAGIAAHSDVLQAQTQLDNVRIDLLTAARQRAQLEHAIAVLLGKAPAEFTLAPLPPSGPAAQPSFPAVPAIPVGVPSTLLQRRPDIAAAERRVAAANEQIGIARAAYFPSLNLSASYGFGASQVAGLFSASNGLWSLGLSAAQTLFDAGATRARVAGAEAGRDAAIARYRQTVLAAFAEVEDQLAASRALEQQQELRLSAASAADQVEQQMLNRYRAGQVGYTDVVNAQVTALNARRALLQAQADRQATAVALIQSLGGGWRAP